MMRIAVLPFRLNKREPTHAFWRSHFEARELGCLTPHEYRDRHGSSLKNFGNWRGQHLAPRQDQNDAIVRYFSSLLIGRTVAIALAEAVAVVVVWIIRA